MSTTRRGDLADGGSDADGAGGAAAVVEGKIYVGGGRPPRGSDFAVYDPAADVLTVLPEMPTQRNHLGMGAIGGKVYVVGGGLRRGLIVTGRIGWRCLIR